MGELLFWIIYIVVGVTLGCHVYAHQRSLFPCEWFQGHTRGRAVVTSVAVAVAWPGALVLAGLLRVPFVGKWIMAFILWERPQPR